MSDRESQFRTPLYHGNNKGGLAKGRSNASPKPPAKGKEGWDAYRKWMSRVSDSAERRAPLDPAIYSWKGYHNWADKVKNSWKPE
jgi:hypothetical protein